MEEERKERRKGGNKWQASSLPNTDAVHIYLQEEEEEEDVVEGELSPKRRGRKFAGGGVDWAAVCPAGERMS